MMNSLKCVVICLVLFFTCGEGFTKDQKMLLSMHNYYRKRHSAPPLRLDDRLNRQAQQWADRLARDWPELLARDPYNPLEHSPQNGATPYGENLGYANFGNPVYDSVNRWYDEEKAYTYRTRGNNRGITNHFTQIVWKATRKMGCGVSEAPGSQPTTILVCQYSPRGNFESASGFAKNVLEPKAGGSTGPPTLEGRDPNRTGSGNPGVSGYPGPGKSGNRKRPRKQGCPCRKNNRRIKPTAHIRVRVYKGQG